MSDAAAIQVNGVRYVYPSAETPALDGVTLSIQPGEKFGLLGPNGSGKTTLFRLIATLLRVPAEAGHVRVFEADVVTQATEARQALGVVFQSTSLDGELTVQENLLCQAKLYGMGRKQAREKAAHWAERLRVSDRLGDKVKTLSGGLARRVEVAKALVHGPKLLLMDEPTTGMDPTIRAELWEALEALREADGLTIALTTHLMDEAERCDRLVLLDQGRVVTTGRPDELRAALGHEMARLRVGNGTDPGKVSTDITALFGPWGDGGEPYASGGMVCVPTEDPIELMQSVRDRWPGRFVEVTIGRPSLEDVFTKLTGRDWGPADSLRDTPVAPSKP